MLSVTTQPSPAVSKSYCQRATGRPSTEVTSKANRRPGSASVIVESVLHLRKPRRFLPRNFAPRTGWVAPPTQRRLSYSMATLASLPGSLTRAYTASGVASISIRPMASGVLTYRGYVTDRQLSRRSIRLTPAATVVARIQPDAVKPAATHLSASCMYQRDLLPKSTIGTSRSAV